MKMSVNRRGTLNLGLVHGTIHCWLDTPSLKYRNLSALMKVSLQEHSHVTPYSRIRDAIGIRSGRLTPDVRAFFARTLP